MRTILNISGKLNPKKLDVVSSNNESRAYCSLRNEMGRNEIERNEMERNEMEICSLGNENL